MFFFSIFLFMFFNGFLLFVCHHLLLHCPAT